jgi:aspartate aminotransferase
MVAQFQKRRDSALAILRSDPRIEVLPPDGAFYLFVRAPGAGREPDAGSTFAAYLLEQCDVAVVPGAAFYTNDWVRISYAAEQSVVDDAMRRVVKAFGELA